MTAARLPDGRIMIEIHDEGIGLAADDFATINHKLANPPTVDAGISQNMGLYVVGRLAERHGIRVQLRPSGERSGTTSLVMLPDTLADRSPDAQPDSDTLTLAMVKSVPGSRQADVLASLGGGSDSGDAFSDYEAWQDEPAGTRPAEEPRPAATRPRPLPRRAPGSRGHRSP